MTHEPLRFSGSITPIYEEFLGEHRCLLEQAVAKVVRVAQRVGVTHGRNPRGDRVIA